MTDRAYVGLGANLGEPRAALAQACAAMAALPGTVVRARSADYLSSPIDAAGPPYLNAVVALDTTLVAEELLCALHAIEAACGRDRPYRNAPRTLDLDLLLWGDRRCDTPALTLPHPRLHLRAFVLEPLAELAPALEIPGLGPLAFWRARAAGQQVQRQPARACAHGHIESDARR